MIFRVCIKTAGALHVAARVFLASQVGYHQRMVGGERKLVRQEPMRILIATVTAGGGHLAAAAALEEAWRTLRPADVLDKIDLVKFFSPLHRKIHTDGYLKLVEHAPD